jgi:hypothetical protein
MAEDSLSNTSGFEFLLLFGVTNPVVLFVLAGAAESDIGN